MLSILLTMNLQKTLQSNGLSEKEAQVYLTLLELNEASPGVIARRSTLKRPTVYVILESLKEKGLVGHVRRNSMLYYRVLDPHLFVEDQQRRYKQLENALPDLLSLHKRYAVNPVMTVYEGKAGIVQIMDDTLKSQTEILCWADAQCSVLELLPEYYPRYIETKVKRKIWLRGIFSYDKHAVMLKKSGIAELREVYVIPKEKFPFANEINIYDNKIAIISYADKIGVIIENENIAQTQRSIFNFAFEYAKILEPQILSEHDKEFLKS